MSRRTAEASKAIRLAWQKEQERVLLGKGTRDWDPEQQQDIIDKGKAYDENGKAFIGHHMKSAEAYPEFQGDPNIIQFLSYEEHKAAHEGWRNPTNGYYDYTTGETIDFSEEGYVPCAVIDLSQPIITISVDTVNTETKSAERVVTNEHGVSPPTEESKKAASTSLTVENGNHKESIAPQNESKKTSSQNTTDTKFKPMEAKTGLLSRAKIAFGKGRSTIISKGKKIVSGANRAVKWGMEHEEIIEAGIVLIENVAPVIFKSKKNSSNSNRSDRHTGQTSTNTPSIDKRSSFERKNNTKPVSDTPKESPIRSSPSEHKVSGHSQRYHTKDGVVVREKKAYPRGRKKSNDK